jgi:hypothetical protein
MNKENHTKTAHLQRWTQSIVGKNFLGCETAQLTIGRELSPYEKGILREMPFTVETLKSCKDSYVLVAVPYGISVNKMRKKFAHLFANPEDSWVSNAKFADDEIPVGWYLIRKSHGPGSRGRNFITHQLMERQGIIGGPDEVIAPASIVIYAMVANALTRGGFLFSGMKLNTSSWALTRKDVVVISCGHMMELIEIGFLPICSEGQRLGAATMKKVY